MTVLNPEKDRKVIPRWRNFENTLILGELGSYIPNKAHKKVTIDFLSSKLNDWHKNRTKFFASDLVGAAVTLGREVECVEAARFLLQDETNSSVWMRKLAERTLISLGIHDQPGNIKQALINVELEELREQVRIYRQLLRMEPRDPIIWVDLARVYAILGEKNKAEQCMVIALQLAKDNRFILRSASRLWVHLGDPLRAHDIISKAPSTRDDPWLLAAEVALSELAEKNPRFVKRGRLILNNDNFSAAHKTELASALATLELSHGNLKQSKKLFKLSLQRPNENSLAQAAWASKHNQSIRFNFDIYADIKNIFEASYLIKFHQKQWIRAVNMCRLWRDDQPFSVEPYVTGSYILLTMLDKYEEGKNFAKSGLTANQSDFSLLNNMAFADINLQNYDAAKKYVQKIERDIKVSTLPRLEQTVLNATKGLLAFRTGDSESGRRLYLEAQKMAKAENDMEVLAAVVVYHTIEEIKYSGIDCSRLISKVHKVIKSARKSSPSPVIDVLENKINFAAAKQRT